MLKICGPEIVGFLIFALYSVYRDEPHLSKKCLRQSLSYDRFWESAEDI